MTRHCDFSVQARTSAPPSTVYRLLRDGASWPRWSPINSFTLEREGSEGGESLGAIRVFRTGTVHSRELLVELDVDRRLSYTALSGLPLRDHRADVDLTELADGTQITWREQFTARVPGMGWLLKNSCADSSSAASPASPLAQLRRQLTATNRFSIEPRAEGRALLYLWCIRRTHRLRPAVLGHRWGFD